MLALSPHSKKVLGSVPAWGAVVLGACSPQAFGAQVGYLLGLSLWSLHVLPVFTRVSSDRTPTQKHAEEQKKIALLTKIGHDHLAWSPGAIKAARCP